MIPVMEGMVSVVIPVYNRSAWVEESLQSVLRQTHSNLEILLCDDGSDDNTAHAMDRLAEIDSSRIRVLHLSHRGPGPTREAGRAQARGEFIQYLDSDDRLHPEKFARQIAALRNHPGCGIAYGRTRLINQNGDVLEESYKQIQGKEFLFPGLLVDRWWCTHTPLYRREVCDRIGAWSDLRYSQDWEYDARAGALKTRLVFVGHAVSDHRTHDAPERQTGKGRWLTPEAQVFFFQSLHVCALEAGVSPEAPEMRHFVRWVFTAARSAGCAGDIEPAKQLLALARQTHSRFSVEMAVYRGFAQMIGWQRTANLAEGIRYLFSRKSGRHTQRQSWMENKNDCC